MRFFLHILLLIGIAVGLSSCDAISGLLPGGSSNNANPANDDSNLASADPAITDPADGATTDDPSATSDGGDGSSATDGSVSGEEFGDPVVEESTPVGNVPLDLITSTDPEERIRLVQRDRPDPFDILRTTPTVEVPEEVLNPPVPSAPDSPNNGSSGNSANGTGSNSSGPNGSSIDGSGSNSRSINGDSANGSGSGSLEDSDLADIPELVPFVPPPPPQPNTARAVTVTGVVQIGTISYAIVDAPNEPHGRYVRTGQFLSNGQVLVKRINMSPGVVDPVVILEEFGVEVARQVGVPGVRPEPAGTDDAPASEPEGIV